MKKLFLSVLVVTFSTAAFSQTATTTTAPAKTERKSQPTIDEKAESFSGRMMKELNLTADQRQQVKAAKVKQLTAIKVLDDKYPGAERKEHQAEYKPIQDKFIADLKLILTPEQFKSLEEKKEKRQAARSEVNKK